MILMRIICVANSDYGIKKVLVKVEDVRDRYVSITTPSRNSLLPKHSEV